MAVVGIVCITVCLLTVGTAVGAATVTLSLLVETPRSTRVDTVVLLVE
jgi:hypothetical protein